MLTETSRKLSQAGCEKVLMVLGRDKYDPETECKGCLNFNGIFSPSPKIAVWSTIDEAAKQKKKKKAAAPTKKSISQSGYLLFLILGSFLTTLGMVSLIWKPFDLILRERLRMMKGLPAYDWWQNPPDEVLLSAYVFNYTNSEEFMNGSADKLIVQEIGPYIFREKLYHNDVVKNNNNTLSYTALRKAIFLPELNKLNPKMDTIIVPNLVLLGASSYISDAAFITKLGLKMITNRAGSKPFSKVTVDEYFWNFTDPVLRLGISLFPSFMPTDNVGILNQIYKSFEDRVTVKIGVDNGPREFFKIDKYNGAPGMQVWPNETCDSVQGSSEGVSYHQDIRKEDTIYYLRKTICRAVPLYYTGDVIVRGVKTYRFELPNTTFARPPEGQEECYRDSSYPTLLSGLSDVSPCYYNFPIASSFPHFMYADPKVTEKLEGLSPNWEKHGSVALIEPNTGVPLTAWARSQSSLIMHDMSYFPSLKRFSNVALPMFWLEYKQMGLPPKIYYVLYFMVNVIKPYQVFFSVLMLIVGAFFYFIGLSRLWRRCLLVNSRAYSTIDIKIKNSPV
ncbi:scavenger receptor class B member 1-like isoform X2 [Cimex lectularius]|nr:scavenger receptor class B member 1-like isoform X2 [Cimex lectularius]